MFVQGAAQNRVKQICGGCPVKMECLADALDNRIEFGVWGGMTERERRGSASQATTCEVMDRPAAERSIQADPSQVDVRQKSYASA